MEATISSALIKLLVDQGGITLSFMFLIILFIVFYLVKQQHKWINTLYQQSLDKDEKYRKHYETSEAKYKNLTELTIETQRETNKVLNELRNAFMYSCFMKQDHSKGDKN